MQRFFDKFHVLTGFKLAPKIANSPMSITNGTENEEGGRGVFNSNAALASLLHKKIGNIVKANQKLNTLKSEFALEIVTWSNNFNNTEIIAMIKEFNSLMSTQLTSETNHLEKLDKIKISLALVNEREKKQKELLSSRSRQLKILKDNETKHGLNANTTTLASERLEEINGNLEVVSRQLIRAIEHDLRDSFIEYICSLQIHLKKAQDASGDCGKFLQNMSLSTDLPGSTVRPSGTSQTNRRSSQVAETRTGSEYPSPSVVSNPNRGRERNSKSKLEYSITMVNADDVNSFTNTNTNGNFHHVHERNLPQNQNNLSEMQDSIITEPIQFGTHNVPTRITNMDMRTQGYTNSYGPSEHWV